MLEGSTVPLGTHREDWYMAIWKTVVIMIVGLLQRRRLATSGNNSLEAKNYSLPWLKFEAVFPSLDPRTVWNIWTSWGTKLDRTSRPRKPPFFEGLPVYLVLLQASHWSKRFYAGTSQFARSVGLLPGPWPNLRSLPRWWQQAFIGFPKSFFIVGYPNLLNFLFWRNGVDRKN